MSRRFGRNKALEVFRGKRLIDHGIESLRSFCDPIMVVANDLEAYYNVSAALIQDIIPREGPLGGIYTALLFSPHEWVFVKATDMPFLAPELVSAMLKMRERTDLVVPLYNDRYEPLLALYNKRCLPAIVKAIEAGERQIISFYKKVKVKTLAEKDWRAIDPEGRSFWNINTPEDWEKLQWS
jgi:molybdopterin-guanine dinucleotide biosynthesis protein A